MQIAVPAAAIAVAAAFWFFTVHDHIVFVPGSAIRPWTNCGVAVLFPQTPPAMVVPAGQVAVHDELAPAPELLGPVQVA